MMKTDDTELYVRSPNGLLLVLKDNESAPLPPPPPPPADPIAILEKMEPGSEPQTMGASRPQQAAYENGYIPGYRTRTREIAAVEGLQELLFDSLEGL